MARGWVATLKTKRVNSRLSSIALKTTKAIPWNNVTKDDFHVYIMCNVYTNIGNEVHAIPFLIFNFFTQNQMNKRYTYLWTQEAEHYTSTCKNYRKWLQLLHYIYHHPITLAAGKSGWMWTRQARYKITWLSWKFKQPRNTFCFSVFCLSVTP